MGFSLAQNHAFIDGNKRLAAHAVLVFLALNGFDVDCTEWHDPDCHMFISGEELKRELGMKE